VKIAQGWENVTIALNDGRSFAGQVKKETADEIVVYNQEDGDVTIKKSDIKTRNRALSGMPEEFRQILTKQELRDLVEFLASQK
jgi:putative heme-binding domain-containing protein